MYIERKKIIKTQLFAGMCSMFENELEEFVQNENMIEHCIDASLVKVIKKRRNLQNDSDFDDNDKQTIKQQYQKLRETEKAFTIFEILRDCGDFPTVAKVLEFLVTDCHQGHHQESDKHKVHKEIIQQLNNKPELKAWVIKELNRGKPGCCKMLNKPWFNFKRYFLPLATYSMKLISFHLDYWKDLVVFFALRHYCSYELVGIENHGSIKETARRHLPEVINSINLDLLSWYILAMIIISHMVLIVTTCLFLNKNKKMFRMEIRGVLFLGALFPIHFSNIGLMTLKLRLEKHKNELVVFFKEFEHRELDNAAANRQYHIIQRKIEKTEENYIAMVKLRNSNGKWETLFEHLPSAVLITSLLIMSYSEVSLRKFLVDTFMYEFAEYYLFIIICMALITTTSCVSSVIAMR